MPEAAVIYARTSSPNQRNNFSIDGQISECWTYAENRGWNVKHIFVDECETARTINRTNFELMMERAKSRYFDIIVVWKLDRFCRSLADLVNVERYLQNYGVSLSSATEYIDTTTSVGRFNYRNLASVAELERELIGERSRLGLYVLAQKGKWPNHSPPLGYDKKDDGTLSPNEEQVSVVRWIFTRYLQVKSMPLIAFELERNEVKIKSLKWSQRTIRDIICNSIYIGNYNVASFSKHIEEYRLISDDLFASANNLRQRYKLASASRQEVPSDMRDYQLKQIHEQFLQLLSCESSETK